MNDQSKIGMFLDWRRAQMKRDYTATMPAGTVWVLEWQTDYNSVVAFRECYRASDNEMCWVPLSEAFESFAQAQQAVQKFNRSTQPVCLNEKGEIIPTGVEG